MTYNEHGKRIRSENLAGQVTTTAWDQFACTSVGELISVAKNAKSAKHAYDFDDIGNRLTSSERGTNSVYAANQLNQYSAVDDFTPQFDDDGNQTLIKTSTGIWQVQYNGENRPILWTCIQSNNSNNTNNQTISMLFDRMGRRVEYLETTTTGDNAVVTNTHHRFVYNGYLCVQRLDAANNNAADLLVAWDPTELVATRPLFMMQPGGHAFFCTHDGNKNVSEVFFFQQAYGIAAHYEYAPFGADTASTRDTSVTSIDARTFNPFRFSSEYADDALGLVYYNYRNYNPADGRWMGRDPVEDNLTLLAYQFCRNRPIAFYDYLGWTCFYLPGPPEGGWNAPPTVVSPPQLTENSEKCHCGRDIVYVGDYLSPEVNTFEKDVRAHVFGTDNTNYVFRKISDFNPNKLLKDGECVCRLIVAMHGDFVMSKTSGPIAGIITKEAVFQETKEKAGISELFKGVKFCDSCVLELRTCHIGRSEILKENLKKVTGGKCTIVLHEYPVVWDGSEPFLGVLSDLFHSFTVD